MLARDSSAGLCSEDSIGSGNLWLLSTGHLFLTSSGWVFSFIVLGCGIKLEWSSDHFIGFEGSSEELCVTDLSAFIYGWRVR